MVAMVPSTLYRGQKKTLMIMDLATMAHTPKNHSKISKMAYYGQNFLRLRRAKRGFAQALRDHAQMETPFWTHIPVGSEGPCPPRERSTNAFKSEHSWANYG